jgi:hypothetical protein
VLFVFPFWLLFLDALSEPCGFLPGLRRALCLSGVEALIFWVEFVIERKNNVRTVSKYNVTGVANYTRRQLTPAVNKQVLAKSHGTTPLYPTPLLHVVHNCDA